MSERNSTRSRGPYHLGFEIFFTKKEIRERVKRIMSRPMISDLDDSDDAFMRDLVLWHPRAKEKIGVGISFFEMRIHPLYRRTVSWWIVRRDGSETDFSYLKCLQPPTDWQRFVSAARLEIQPQILNYYRRRMHNSEQDEFYCPVMEDMLPRSQMEVDHKWPYTFDRIIKDFVVLKKINTKMIIYRRHSSGLGNVFDDFNLSEQWAHYHLVMSDLWLISKAGHRKLTKERRSL